MAGRTVAAFSLTKRDQELLKALSEANGVSKTEQIRRLITSEAARLLRGEPNPPNQEPLPKLSA
jgi:hypothetical protein